MNASLERPARPHRRAVWASVVVALLWSIGLLVAAVTFPMYDSEAVTGSTVIGGAEAGPHTTTTISHSTATLVEVNGVQALAFMALPLLVSLVVAVALLRPRPGRVARLVAWGVTGALGVLTMLTVGPAMVPVTGCLLVACAFDLGARQGSPGRVATE